MVFGKHAKICAVLVFLVAFYIGLLGCKSEQDEEVGERVVYTHEEVKALSDAFTHPDETQSELLIVQDENDMVVDTLTFDASDFTWDNGEDHEDDHENTYPSGCGGEMEARRCLYEQSGTRLVMFAFFAAANDWIQNNCIQDHLDYHDGGATWTECKAAPGTQKALQCLATHSISGDAVDFELDDPDEKWTLKRDFRTEVSE
eukprot:gene369-170_t